jgi:hypothetical protein
MAMSVISIGTVDIQILRYRITLVLEACHD